MSLEREAARPSSASGGDEHLRRGRTGILAVILGTATAWPSLWLAFATDDVTQRPSRAADPAFHEPCCLPPDDWNALLLVRLPAALVVVELFVIAVAQGRAALA